MENLKLVNHLLKLVAEKLEKVGTDLMNENISMSNLEDEIFNINDVIYDCGKSTSEIVSRIEKSESLKLFSELMEMK